MMKQVLYHKRRALRLENESTRLTTTLEGGHVAEIFHKASGVNPLWTPPWPSVEPSSSDATQAHVYGPGEDAKLLSGILGHNICLDTFGTPSPEERAAGIPMHGEAWSLPYHPSGDANSLTLSTTLPQAELRFERRIRLAPRVIHFAETVENLSGADRPIAWTQHVTLGPPFLKLGHTQFRIPATRSKVAGASFNDGAGSQQPDAEFDWPFCPDRTGGTIDLRVFPAAEGSGGFTAHLMNPAQKLAWFLAWSPESKVLFGYVWNRSDFPWLARWEENHLRKQPPWNGQTLSCGMEFGVSPMTESRRQAVARGTLFGVPAFRWVPARSHVNVNYCAFITQADAIPQSVAWDGGDSITFDA